MSLIQFAGTSIGFKNIASKIAYDLRLWLGTSDSPNTSTKPLDTTLTQQQSDNENQPIDMKQFQGKNNMMTKRKINKTKNNNC